MFKKIASILLAVMLVLSMTIIAVNAAEADQAVGAGSDSEAIGAGDGDSVGADSSGEEAAGANDSGESVGASHSANTVYFQVDPSLWKNFKTVRLYMYAHDGSDFPLNTWGTKKGNMTDDGNNIWAFDFDEKGYTVESGKQYGMIFCTDTGIQTCDIIFDSSIMGDTAACTGDMVENNVDSNKKSYYVKWKNADSSKYAPPLTITSIGNIVGEALWAGDTKYSILVKFISSTGADGIDNAIKYNGKDMQQTLDDTATAFGLTQDDIEKAIKESGRTDIKWDKSKSTAPKGSSTEGGGDTNTNTNNNSGGGSTTTTTGGGSTGSKSVSSGQETTIFFVFGGVMLAAAGIIFLARKRRDF